MLILNQKKGGKKNIEKKCYLCGHEATFEDARNTSALDQIITCQNQKCCNRKYRVSFNAKTFNFEHEPEILNREAKQKIIDYLRKFPEDQIPYLTEKVIETITGVKSENIRY